MMLEQIDASDHSKSVGASRVLILGNSHVNALASALAASDDLSRLPSISIEIKRLCSPTEPLPDDGITIVDAIAQVSRFDSNDILALYIGGTFHNIFGLLQHEIPFDIDASLVAPGIALIPLNVMRDQFREQTRGKSNIFKLKNATKAQVVHLSSPPPKDDEAYIRTKMMRYRGIALQDAHLNDAETRLRLWQLEMDTLRDTCVELGIGFVPAPSDSKAETGFLARDFYGADATHANSAYGASVLRQLVDLAGGLDTGQRD